MNVICINKPDRGPITNASERCIEPNLHEQTARGGKWAPALGRPSHGRGGGTPSYAAEAGLGDGPTAPVDRGHAGCRADAGAHGSGNRVQKGNAVQLAIPMASSAIEHAAD